MALRVQVLSGLSSEEVATLDCDPAWDVSDLKWELERRKNLPEAEQRLLLGTRVLCDKERLGDLATAALTLSLMRLDPQWVGLLQDLRNGRRDWKDMDQELQENREVALAAVQRDPSTLPLLSTELRQDSEIVLAAVQQHGRSLQHALGIARRDPKVLEAALKRDGLAIRFATEEQKGDRHLGLMAVRQNGWALELLGEKLKAEREIVKEAITQEGQAFKFADETLKHDRELMLIALRSNAEALRYMPQEVREDPEALLAARMGVRIRGAGGLQYFKSLLSTAAHEQSDAFRFSDASKMVSSNMAGK
ncbi:unnamed protein product [Cladocopium goreaui]|uniref:Ubiquitin-like domain-containing protein n=1 Tax=Cladocopium goreaui TaxID=2562237 RepID=A0A9P1C8Y0_9DINO|nr:unnamed protein product [Cladocopium goreaui]